jgi:hypothetical protein
MNSIAGKINTMLDKDDFSIQIGLYYKFRHKDKVHYLKEDEAFRVPNTDVLIHFRDGTFWIYKMGKIGSYFS